MRDTYKTVENFQCYFITSTIIEWLSIFVNSTYCNLIIDTIKFYQEKDRLFLYGFVIMPNHFHLIISSNEKEGISRIIRDVKKYSAKLIIKQLQDENKNSILTFFQQNKLLHKSESKYQIWQEGFHPVAIQNIEMFKDKLNYMHNNPVRSGLVDSPEDWIYSSAGYYLSGKNSVLEINEIE